MVGHILSQKFGCLVTKFAKRLKEMAHGLYGLTNAVGNALEHSEFEHVKETPNERLMGLTPRECYIAVSERYLKPMHGEDIIGRMLLESLTKHDNWHTAVVTDSGFVDEAKVIVEHFGVENIAVIRLHRDGCCFTNDSRGYIRLPGVQHFDVDNNGKLPDLTVAVANIAKAIGVAHEEAGYPTGQAAGEDSERSEQDQVRS
ncbi:MAG: hypothetical protein CME87_00280 [Herbaspirillum sp.]|nr:hypothetical protein [Herbaspirillum sp.]